MTYFCSPPRISFASTITIFNNSPWSQAWRKNAPEKLFLAMFIAAYREYRPYRNTLNFSLPDALVGTLNAVIILKVISLGVIRIYQNLTKFSKNNSLTSINIKVIYLYIAF